MATPTMAIVKILRARQDNRPPPSQHIDEYRPKYRRILEILHEAGGEEAVDELTEWIIQETETSGELPPPEDVVDQARTVVDELGLTLSDGSTLEVD